MLHIITGDPLTGKSTFVKKHAKNGDLVIDLDEIARALTITEVSHQYPLHIRQLAIIARQAVIARILQSNLNNLEVWLIHADPNKEQIKRYQLKSAQFHHCTASPQELSERLKTRTPENQAKIRAYYQKKANKAYAEDY